MMGRFQGNYSVSSSKSRAEASPNSLSKSSLKSLVKSTSLPVVLHFDLEGTKIPCSETKTTAALAMTSKKDSDMSSVDNEAQPTDKSTNNRNSVYSIVDDPFFRNYTSPKTMSLARELKSAMTAGYLENERFVTNYSLASPVRPDTDSKSLKSVPDDLQNESTHINIAVIGAAGVGKSTLIQGALGLNAPQDFLVSTLEISMEEIIYTVSLFEMDLQNIDIDSQRKLNWSTSLNGQDFSRIDGVLLLYDVTNRESISRFPATLSERDSKPKAGTDLCPDGLVNSFIPTILVSSKYDVPENLHQIDIDAMERVCFSCVEAVKVSANVPEMARFCLAAILKVVIDNLHVSRFCKNKISFPSSRDSFSSTSQQSELKPCCEDTIYSHQHCARTWDPDHAISSTVVNSSSSYSVNPTTQDSSPSFTSQASLNQNQSSVQTELNGVSSTPAFSTSLPENLASPIKNQLDLAPKNTDVNSTGTDLSFDISKVFCTLKVDGKLSDPKSQFIDEDLVLFRDNEDILKKQTSSAGITFENLVDRLISQSMSRADRDFIDIFLCLYRKFAAPGKLLSCILARLDLVTKDSHMHNLTKAENQFRILNILSKWISTYPGDFAGPSTSHKLEDLIKALIIEPRFATFANEIRLQLQSRVVINDDTGWARTDPDFDSNAGSCIESDSTSFSAPNIKDRLDPDALTSSSYEDDGSTDVSSKISRLDIFERSSSPTHSIRSTRDYDIMATTLIPKSVLPLSKYRFCIIMQISDDEFSDEITRIDWVMLSTIRIRSLIRHVNLSPSQKMKWKDFGHINRMIAHFNYIAKWVASLILMRNKAKHRAMMLEKFINIAQKLRQLNNYNGLAAVLAGLNCISVFRLAQTWCLLNADAQKRFKRLMILMGVQRSHSAYRLAWRNSTSSRIPFLPLHRRDLVSAEEGSRTFLDEEEIYINWKKFEILSEIILPLMRSQMLPYSNLIKSKGTRELILDCKIINDDEDLYKRSLAVEGNASANSDFGRKNFRVFKSYHDDILNLFRVK
ncbi:putative ras guanyl-nucleotide exchange factor [Golovinomyces cichoracearum]|uniref:Putative ras guanyl-nucleotide exchange factor n=1 Tax=Golovinomyces cichoracearum TaxID=62708 RepID=A0A420IUE0_9PEZI|nr:putative ras guanyl-nucleotide exchange factor [Golovinomyces cichoracearum]